MLRFSTSSAGRASSMATRYSAPRDKASRPSAPEPAGTASFVPLCAPASMRMASWLVPSVATRLVVPRLVGARFAVTRFVCARTSGAGAFDAGAILRRRLLQLQLPAHLVHLLRA